MGKLKAKPDIETAMIEHGISQIKLSELTNKSTVHINKIIRGKSSPSLGLAKSIADALGKNTLDIFERVD